MFLKNNKLLRLGAVKRIKDRLKELSQKYRKGEIDLNNVRNSVMAWLGYAKHADTYRLRKELLGSLNFLIDKDILKLNN